MANIKKLKKKADQLNADQKFEESLENCDIVLELSPDDVDMKITKLNNLVNLGRIDEADKVLDSIDPSSLKKEQLADFHNNKAFLLYNKAILIMTSKAEDGGALPANKQEAEDAYKLIVEADSLDNVNPDFKDEILEQRSWLKKQIIFFEDPDSPDYVAAEILDRAFNTFSVEAMDGSGRQPGSRSEVEEVKDMMQQARNANPKDPEIIDTIGQYEEICEEAYERRFVGYKWLMVLVGVVALYFLYAGFSKLGTAGDVMPVRAEQMMNSEIERVGDYLDRMKVAHDTVKEKNTEYIEKQQERLDELSKMDTEDYIKEITKRDRARNWRNIRRGVFWSLMIVLYYFASRPPVFLINKRQRQMAFTSKSANVFKKIIFFLLGIFIAMPSFDRTVVVDSFGSVVGSYDEISPGLIIKIVGILFIVAFIIWLAMILLPVLTIINYLRNYQYEKVDEYFEKAMSTIKGWVGLNK